MRVSVSVLLIVHIISWRPKPDVLGERIVRTAQESGDLVQYRPGDILIAAISPVHTRERESCSKIQDIGIQIVEMINMVIDEINADESILPQVKLGTIMIDSCYSDSQAVRKLVLDILPLMLSREAPPSEPDGLEIRTALVAGVLGGVASSVSMQVATVLQALQVPQVSYLSTSPELSNKARFKYFFRVVPPDSHQAEAILEFAQQRNWTYISIVYEDESYGIHGSQAIKDLSDQYHICISAELPIPRNPSNETFTSIMEKLLNQEARVVALIAKNIDASRLMIAAEKIGGKAREFFWIASDGWTHEIPQSDYKFDDQILHGTVGFRPLAKQVAGFDGYFRNLTVAQNLNNTRNPWFTEYIAQNNRCYLGNVGESTARECGLNETIGSGSFHALALTENVADAVLSLVYALDKYHKTVCKGVPGLCHEISRHNGTNGLAANLYPVLKDINFTNSNNQFVRFDINQDGPSIYDIMSYDADKNVTGSLLEKWETTGVYENQAIRLLKPLSEKARTMKSICSEPCKWGEATILETEACCWHCDICADDEFVANMTQCLKCAKGHKPNEEKDGCDSIEISEISYGSSYGIICACVTCFGMILTLTVTLIFVKHRDTPIVKASGSELCFFVLIGVSFTFLNFFTMMTRPTYTSCIISRVMLGLGPTCTYAGLLSKTVRVVIIFHSKSALSTKMKAYIQPLKIILCTLALMSVQVMVLLAWFLFSPADVGLYYLPNDVVYRACSHLVDLEVMIALLYPFLLVAACTILATINRRVPVGFNETKYIGFSMYTTCIIWLAFLPTFITNNIDYGQRIMTTSICLSLSASTVIICIFAPKCFKILFRPGLNNRNAVMSPSRNINGNGSREARDVAGSSIRPSRSATSPSNFAID